jgi:hypothetical protein
VAAVWRRQTFTAAAENVTPETTRSIFEEHLPTLAALLKDQLDDPLGTRTVLEDTYTFSRMLHGAPAAAGPAADAFLQLVHTRARKHALLAPGRGRKALSLLRVRRSIASGQPSSPAWSGCRETFQGPGSLPEIWQTRWYAEHRLYVNVHCRLRVILDPAFRQCQQ